MSNKHEIWERNTSSIVTSYFLFLIFMEELEGHNFSSKEKIESLVW